MTYLKSSMMPLAFGFFTLAYLALAYTYSADARTFPAGVAWVMLVLTALDLLSRTHTPLGAAIHRVLNPATEPAKGDESWAATWIKTTAVLWIGGFVALMMVIGIVYAVPVYVFGSVRFRGRYSYLMALVVAAATAFLIWLLFGFILRLDLYPGVLFQEN